MQSKDIQERNRMQSGEVQLEMRQLRDELKRCQDELSSSQAEFRTLSMLYDKEQRENYRLRQESQQQSEMASGRHEAIGLEPVASDVANQHPTLTSADYSMDTTVATDILPVSVASPERAHEAATASNSNSVAMVVEESQQKPYYAVTTPFYVEYVLYPTEAIRFIVEPAVLNAFTYLLLVHSGQQLERSCRSGVCLRKVGIYRGLASLAGGCGGFCCRKLLCSADGLQDETVGEVAGIPAPLPAPSAAVKQVGMKIKSTARSQDLETLKRVRPKRYS
ncbi:Irgc [Symbiodinium sp. CCMP2592]|nr:Irgc [Symbiodinium sp. CCMP2592]